MKSSILCNKSFKVRNAEVIKKNYINVLLQGFHKYFYEYQPTISKTQRSRFSHRTESVIYLIL